MADVPNDNVSGLLQILVDEGMIVQQFVDLLSLEQVALRSGDTDELPTLAEKKNLLAVDLERLAGQRNTSLSNMGFAANSQGIEAWCTQYPTQKSVAEAWANVRDLAREARELNRLNGDLIQLRMNVTAAALESLQASKGSLSLYGPDGQSAKPGHRRIDHAV